MRAKLLILLMLYVVCAGFVQARVKGLNNYATGKKVMVTTDHPIASQIGVDILKQGGNVVDAAVAATFALGVLNPFSSGIGGGGFAIYLPGPGQKTEKKLKETGVYVLDFREQAPKLVTASIYDKGRSQGKRLTYEGPLASGVPGEVAGLLQLHRKYGRLPRARLLEPAIKLAEIGFKPSPYYIKVIETHSAEFLAHAPLASLFIPGGIIKPATIIKQKKLAETLKLISKSGRKSFYQGKIAQKIVRWSKNSGGAITLNDLKHYQIKVRKPVTGQYRGLTIHSMPPPSSGGALVVEMLNILESFDLAGMGHNSPRYIQVVVSAMKQAYKDRAKYFGDPDFVKIPLKQLVSKEYAKEISASIKKDISLPKDKKSKIIPPPDDSGTSHLCVADHHGNTLVLTSTINTLFGSKEIVPGTGIVMNNHMDDFSWPKGANTYGLVGSSQNYIQGGKRPLSSMSPTIITKAGKPILALGASGGPRIISATLQVIINVIDFKMNLKQAVAKPRFHHQWKPDTIFYEPDLAEGPTGAQRMERLKKNGLTFKQRDKLGVVQAIDLSHGHLEGVSDPRKYGQPAGF